ncbi:MAG: DEAD/DEAH box helicase, partial [Planctomycetota bacterium]
MDPAEPLPQIDPWFRSRGWTPFEFQLQTWRAYLEGQSGLLHAPTGTGKTLAVWLGPVLEALERGTAATGPAPRRDAAEPCRVLWITPLRALANDTAAALHEPIEALGLPWTIEKRTGDTPASLKAKQRRRLPTCLVTTPESATLLLSYPDSRSAHWTGRCGSRGRTAAAL